MKPNSWTKCAGNDEGCKSNASQP